MVRISYLKHPFQRGYQQQYSEEVFWIKSRFHRQNYALYTLKDCQNEEIIGAFYQAELQRIYKPGDTLWKIDRIVRQRRRGGKREYLVHWQNFPETCNSWIPEENLQDV